MSNPEQKEKLVQKRVSRRQSLAALSAMAAGVALAGCAQQPAAAPGAPGANSTKTFKWKMQSTWSAGDHHQTVPQVFVERMNKATAGQMQIELEPAGTIVPAFEVLDAVHKGVIDCGNSWAGYWTGKSPAFGLFSSNAGGPYGMDAFDYCAWFYNDQGEELYNGLFKELGFNVIGFMCFPEIPEPMGWFKKEIKSWDDFKGLKFRAGGLTAEIMKEAGMTVVILPGGEIIPSGEKGVIDAAEFADPTVDTSLGFQDVWKYYHLPGIHQPTGHMENIVNQAKWDELPQHLKDIWEYTCQASTLQTWINWYTRNAIDLRKLETDHGVNIIRTPEDVLIEVLKAWDKVAARMAGENAYFKKVFDSQREFAKVHCTHRYRAWPDYNFAVKYYWADLLK